MNKKFLSAILFGALMVTSTGTFVSCKDYDEDIENLQGQISSLATKSEVEAKLAQLQSAIDAAKADAVDAADLAALEAKVTSMQATIQAAVEADIAGYKAEIEALIKEVEAVVGEIADFVTDVDLNITTGATEDYAMNFYTITEKENVFEDGVAGALTFTAGKQTQVGQEPIIVRVSPANAVLTPEMVSLVNSKGENLDEYLNVSVEKYTDLLSRAATNNGLWKITPVLKEYDAKQFAKMKYVDPADASKGQILYAVQINNTLAAAEARYVTSAYNITMGEWEPFVGQKDLHFTVDGEPVYKLNNRYSVANNPSLPKFDADKFDGKLYKELIWGWNAADDKDYPAPAVAPIKKDNKWMNCYESSDDVPTAWWSRYGDNRSECPVALAVQGEPMTIAISDMNDKNNNYEGHVAGLYVTLDYEANAVESAPSEWNAWNSYKYTGLNTVVKGTSIEITIDSEETINDYIGFRVYAVNLDGTLVDPDGRAFYVLVGEQAAETQTISATITPTNVAASHSTVKVALTDAQSAVITNLVAKGTRGTVKMYEKNPVISEEYPVAYDVEFTIKDKKAVEAVFTLKNDIKNLINDVTYKATLAYTTASGHTMGEINFELTKAMPTTFPADFAFRPKQETEDGNGKFIAYMIPEGDSYAVPTPFAKVGVKDLDNVFYGLDEYYKFAFATSAKNADKELIEVKVVANEDKEYILEVGAGYIDNATAHAVSVWYTYPGISTYKYTKDGKEVWAIGATHEVAYDKAIEATYACWEDASAFDWGTEKVGDAAVSLKPILKWTAEGVGAKAKLSDIISTNSYNNDFFGVDLESMLNTGKWLAISDKDGADKAITTIQLKAGEQVNPYFVPTIEGNEIKFTQKNTQLDAAPTADHTETLEIVLVDAFGHQVAITLDVTVKAPEKK